MNGLLTRLLPLFFLSLLFTCALTAEEAVSDIPDTAVVPLIINGREIFTFKAELTGFRATARHQRAYERIGNLIEQGMPGEPGYRPITEGMLVMLGDRGLFVVTPGDIDSSRGETTEEVARRATLALSETLAVERERRTVGAYVSAVIQSIGVTALFFLFLFGLTRLVHATVEVASRRIMIRSGAAQAALLPALRLKQIQERVGAVIKILGWLAGFTGAYAWITFVLTRFPQTHDFGASLGAYLSIAASIILSSLGSAIPDLLVIAIIAFIAWFFNRISRLLFDLAEQGKITLLGIHPDTAQPTRRIATALIWVFGIIAAYPYLPGSGSDAFKGISIMVGLVVSLGSSGIMSQAMSGLILMYSRSFRPGDFIRTGETEGIVLSLGMLSTKIRSIRNEELTVPNAVLVSAATTNYSRLHEKQGLLLSAGVTIGYNAPWRQVHALLIMAAERTTGLRKEPSPFVLQTALNDFYVEYKLHATIEEVTERPYVLASLHQNIQDTFNEYGVQIMSPHYLADPAEKAVVPKEQWYAAPAKAPEEKVS